MLTKNLFQIDLEQFVSDAALLAKIKTKFLASKTLYGSGLEVQVKSRIVYLGGSN